MIMSKSETFLFQFTRDSLKISRLFRLFSDTVETWKIAFNFSKLDWIVHLAKTLQFAFKIGILFQVWIRIQANTFKNWANVTLREAGGPSVENLETDFQDGTKLVALVETLQKRKLKHNKKPINQHHELENITIALDAIQEDGLKLVNIGKIFCWQKLFSRWVRHQFLGFHFWKLYFVLI